MAKRVVTLSLHPTREQAAAPEATMHAFNAACQYISEAAWEAQEFGRTALHRLVYYEVRVRFGLPSQLGRSQSSFLCQKCGLAAHADCNGAENVRLRAVALLDASAVQPPPRLEQRTALLTDKLPVATGSR
jgi:hypothetical protein